MKKIAKNRSFYIKAAEAVLIMTVSFVICFFNVFNNLFGLLLYLFRSRRLQKGAEERLLDALNRHRDDPPGKLLPEIRADVDAFVGDAPQFDDITMMAFRFSGKA